MFDPGRAINCRDNVFSFISLVNGDAIVRNNEVKTKEGGNDTEGMNRPMFFKDLNNEVISFFIGTETQEVISGTAEDNWSVFKDSTVN